MPLKLTPKEWTTLSLLALLIAGTTAYLNLFRETDSVTVLISSTPQVGVFDEGHLFAEGKGSMSFSNTGNRSAEIYNPAMLINQKRHGLATECTTVDTVVLSIRLEPFVISQNQLLVKQFQLDTTPDPTRRKVGDKIVFSAKKDLMLDRLGTIVQVCFAFTVAIPSVGLRYPVADFGDFAIDKRQGYMEVDRDVQPSPTFTLIHENHPF